MSLSGKIVLRPNQFSQPDYTIVYKGPDGWELVVGRIFRNHGFVGASVRSDLRLGRVGRSPSQKLLG